MTTKLGQEVRILTKDSMHYGKIGRVIKISRRKENRNLCISEMAFGNRKLCFNEYEVERID